MGISRDIPSREPEAAPEFEVLYEQLRLPVYRVIRGIVLDSEAAEKLTWEAFEQASRRLQAPGDASPVWMYGIAVDVALARSRRPSWRRLPPLGFRRSSRSAPVAPSGEAERALSALSPDMRALVVLTFYVHLAEEEVATALHLPREAVTDRLDRAVRLMRDALQITDHGVGRERLKG
jgi:DNA-directed RNA polymerase specialized sigma24 family protein